MRVVPVSLYYHDSPALYEKVKASAEVTHAHPLGIDGAAVLARAQAVTASLNNRRPFSPEALLEDLAAFARTEEMQGKIAAVTELLARRAEAQEAATRLGMSVLVHESVPFALYSFLRHPHTFMECVLFAVLNGGNRDSLGAMAGAIAGAYLGVEAIPSRWRKKLENNNHIEALARELAARL
jgi:poly(ADP-ribose) glycohydrolase ARH3